MIETQLIDNKEIINQLDEVIDDKQIRMARAGLDWTAQDLAKRSGLGVATIRRAEETPPRVSAGTLFVIQHAFEDAGVIFLDGDQASPGGGRGVRLPKGSAS